MAETRAAWVTGAGGELGGAVVRRLGRDGWRGVASARSAAPAALPPFWQAEAGALDSADTAQRAAQSALTAFGRLDLAVLAAGAWEGGSAAHAGEAEALERMWRANVETTWHCARAAAQAMARGQATGPRAIVLVSALTALARPSPAGQAAYRASKAAVASLADGLAADLAADGVAVFALAPVTLATEANRRAMPSADASRWVRLEDVVEIVSFLATPAARALSGAVLPLGARLESDRP